MKLSQKKETKTLISNKKTSNDGLYVKNILSEKININFKNINSNLDDLLQDILKQKEGICVKEGYIKPNSIKLMSYSRGELYSNSVQFQVLYECL